MKPSPADVEREALAREIDDILGGELERLEEAMTGLERVRQTGALSADDLSVLEEAEIDLRRSAERLSTLRAAPNPEAARTTRLAYALRRSVFARTALLRHTPPIAGHPTALDPIQCAVIDRPDHLIEYARSGARLFVGDDGTLRGEDHPILAAAASAITAAIYETHPSHSLLFSSATGAMNTALDFMAHEAKRQGKRNLIGARSWMEVTEYVRVEHRDCFEVVDETDVEGLRRAFTAPDVLGLSIETLINHPSMPVARLPEIVEGAQNKILLLDCAHTPEYDPSERLRDTADQRLSIMAVVSGVKFLQAGLDLAKSGLLSFWDDRGHDAVLELRERSGRTPSYEEAWLAALETRRSFTSRLVRYDRNTERAAERLAAGLAARPGIQVVSPWLQGHADHRYAREHYRTGGRFIYIRLDSQRGADAAYRTERSLVAEADCAGLPLVSTCTFGLAVPHTNVIVHPHEGPILRLSPGSGPWSEVSPVIDLWVEVLRRSVR